MDFTFGIITSPDTCNYLDTIIESIERQNIPNYEIIIVGNIPPVDRLNTKTIPFDESIIPGWISHKKNIISYAATYENIVFLHDYICIEPGWYAGLLQYGNDFDIMMTPVINCNGGRFRDWLLNVWFMRGYRIILRPTEAIEGHALGEHYIFAPRQMEPFRALSTDADEALLDHTINVTDAIRPYMYVSGTYWIAKRKVMLDCQINEALVHCQGEDVEWSQRALAKYRYCMNTGSSVRLLKEKAMSQNILYVSKI